MIFFSWGDEAVYLGHTFIKQPIQTGDIGATEFFGK